MGLFFLTPCFLRMPDSPKIVCFRFLKKFKKVKLCLDGKLQYKPIKDVEFTLACNGNANCIHVTRLDIKLGCVPRQNCKCFHLYNSGCSWYDQVICDGEVVRDLYRWWFQSRCSNSRWTGGRPHQATVIISILVWQYQYWGSILSSSECLWSLDLGPKWDQIQGLDRNCLYQVMSLAKIWYCYKMLLCIPGKRIRAIFVATVAAPDLQEAEHIF